MFSGLSLNVQPGLPGAPGTLTDPRTPSIYLTSWDPGCGGVRTLARVAYGSVTCRLTLTVAPLLTVTVAV